MSPCTPRRDATKTESLLVRPWLGVSELAELLGINRRTVWYRLSKVGIKSDGGKVWTSQLRDKMPDAWDALVSSAAMRDAGVA